MRIAVNASPLLQDTPADTGNVASEMLFRLCNLHPEIEFILIAEGPGTLPRPLPANAQLVELKPILNNSLGRYIWRQRQWPGALKKHKIDRLLCIDEILPVPDDLPAYLVLTRGTGTLDSAVASQFIRRFRTISVFSEFMREQVNKRFGGLDNKMEFLRPGVSEAYMPINWEEREEVKREYAGGMEYFMAVGSIHPDNNIIPLLKAFSLLKKRLRTNMKLVLTGRLTAAGEEIAEAMQTYKFRDDVVWLQKPDEAILARLTAGAYAVVFTAGADGLPVPLYAALRSQVPAVVIHAGAAPEAGGDAALNAVAGDITDLSEKMAALYKDEMLRSRLLAHIPHIPSWDDAALMLGRTITS